MRHTKLFFISGFPQIVVPLHFERVSAGPLVSVSVTLQHAFISTWRGQIYFISIDFVSMHFMRIIAVLFSIFSVLFWFYFFFCYFVNPWFFESFQFCTDKIHFALCLAIKCSFVRIIMTIIPGAQAILIWWFCRKEKITVISTIK